MTILYVETNFLMCIALGRDPGASAILTSRPPSVQLAIPDICFMEAYAALKQERRYNEEFKRSLKDHSSEIRRDQMSIHVRTLVFHLEQSMIALVNRFNEVDKRFSQALNNVSRQARIIGLVPEMIEACETHRLIDKDLTDNLILHCALSEANRHRGEVQVFLSENTKDFGKEDVKEALAMADVKYFSKVDPLLGWLGSLPSA